MNKVSGWGRFPMVESTVLQTTSQSRLNTIVREHHQLIARGLGRSYGDSSLGNLMVALKHLDCIVDFNVETGVITCDAGCTFQQLEQFLVPHGWFLPVVPGTWFVTVGGAIASDIHGKNHHVSGTFCEHVLSMDICVGTGEAITCSKVEHKELYHATCGGMGLTGIVCKATIQLLKIRSNKIQEKKCVASSLEEALALFEQYESSTYTVAWIDCLTKGRNLGRSVLMVGEHYDDQVLDVDRQGQVVVPFDLPRACMNKLSMSLFNNLYYAAGMVTQGTNLKCLTRFFHPLDAVGDWNRCYGALGFIQYQFVIPKSCGVSGLRLVLSKIAESGRGSFLAVLKQFGPANMNLLSFPIEGYTVALDFRLDNCVLELLVELDDIILELGGKFYLTKDSRMTQNTFFRSTPKLAEFQSTREKYGSLGKFVSKQSIRLGIDQ